MQMMRESCVWNACFCGSDAEAKALFSSPSGSLARSIGKLNAPQETIQVQLHSVSSSDYGCTWLQHSAAACISKPITQQP